MRVGEVADVLLGYGVWNALNLDGGGSTSMAMQDPADNVRKLINVSSDPPPGRSEASNLAVYSDGLDPHLHCGRFARRQRERMEQHERHREPGRHRPPPRYVRRPSGVGRPDPVLPGRGAVERRAGRGRARASVDVDTQGITTVTYFATDAAGNDEGGKELTSGSTAPGPTSTACLAAGCRLWPPNHEMRQVAVVTASDALSGVAEGALQVTATSSEPSNPSDPDVLVAPDGAGGIVVYLRAERRGNGSGRVYTITATATDRADNVRTATATCVVPHDQGQN